MLLSTKGRYGLKAMFELSLFHEKEPVPLKKICDKYGISENYLEQLLGKLKRAGYVKSTRGVQGGYNIAYAPDEITVGMILRTLEGDITTSECVNNEVCSRESVCVTRVIFEKIENSINDVIDNITLSDMINEEKTIFGGITNE